MDAFRVWLHATLSKENARSVVRTVEDLHAGRSVTVCGAVYEPLLGVRLTPDMVTVDLCAAAREWAPRGKKTDDPSKIVDCSNGWAFHHPLRRMLKYKVEVLEPERERLDAAEHARGQLQRMRPLDASVCKGKKRKAWTVAAHAARNAEQTSSTAPFLSECWKQAQAHGYQWTYVEEFPFGNRQRCDLFLSCDACDVVVESKTRNLLHGVGQVLHYNELAQRDVPDYATKAHHMVVVLAVAPRPLELETARKFGVHVWWPDGPPFPPLVSTTAT